jgi:hypothetical protein
MSHFLTVPINENGIILEVGCRVLPQVYDMPARFFGQ